MAKKRKKKNNKIIKKIFTAIFILILIIGIAFFGLKGFNEVNQIIEEIEKFEVDVPDELGSQIDLPTKINDNITITWVSTNEQYITNNGLITYPDFESDDQVIQLIGKIKVDYKEILSEIIANILGITTKDVELNINLKAQSATDELKVKSVINKLTIINETYYSINLPTKLCYESINIKWQSSHQEIINNQGKVKTPSVDTIVTLSATIISNDYTEVKDFVINILSKEPVLEIVNDKFDDQASTSKYATLTSTSGITYFNARILEEEGSIVDNNDLNAMIPSFIRLRNDDSNGYFEMKNIINPQELSFKYKFSGSQTTEKSKLIITIIINGKEIKEEKIVNHEDQYLTFTKYLGDYDQVSIKVEHVDEWKTETFIDIDDVIVYANTSIKDLETWVINNTPTSISKATILPFTTQYGGCITWESNSNALTKQGIVHRADESQKVTLTATIEYLNEFTTLTVEVTVKGKAIVQALEIYFIDIGKYGAGDCGECTYIKYGDVDIIVDAGDHFESTIQAITEVINQKLEDDVIEYMIATHPDGDHIGGMTALFENYEIKNLIKFEGTYFTKKYENLEKAFLKEQCNVFEIKSDIIDKNLQERFITLSNDVYISFIDTKYYDTKESNGKSIVFTLEAYGTRVLMTGDADNATGHTDLEEKYKDQVGDIDVLKVVHHGTANGTTLEFLKVVDPEIAIICNGNYLGNKHAHPTPRALSNLYTYDNNMKVYAITGGGTIDGVANKTNNTYKCSSEDRFNQRNGLITLIIDNNGIASLTSEYYGSNILEIKDTDYYKAILQNGLK